MLSRPQIFPIFLVLYEVVVYLSTDMYLPAMPSLRDFFSLDTQAVQASLSIWFLGSGSCQWLTGPISDYAGRKPIMLISILIFIITCVICAFTKNYHMFLAARFVQGAMIGPIFVGGYAAIHEKFSEQVALKTIALMGVVTIAAPTLGPMLGAFVLHHAHWQAIFGLLAISAAMFGSMIALSMPETLSEKHPLTIKSVGNNYLLALKSFNFIGPIITNCCTFAAMIVWLTLGVFVTHNIGMNEHEYSLIQACAFGCYILGNRIIPIAIKRFSMQQIVQFGLIFGLSLGCAALFTFIITPSNPIAIIALSLITFGAGMCGPNLQKLAMNSSDQPLGLKMAIYATLISMSGAIFSFSASWVHANWISLISLMLGCLIIACIVHSTWIIKCQT